MSDNTKTRLPNWLDFILLVLLLCATKGPRQYKKDRSDAIAERKDHSASCAAVEPDPALDQRQIFAVRIQELSSSNNEYFRAISTGVWYFSAGFLVTAGWVFNSIKDLTSASGSLQFRDLLSRYPNLCFPVIAVFMVNVLFLNISSGLAYVFLKGRQELEHLRKVGSEPEFISRRDIKNKTRFVVDDYTISSCTTNHGYIACN